MSAATRSGPSEEPPVIALHLGLHKTGTTWIQDVLFANAAALQARGVGAPRRRAVRANFTMRVMPGAKPDPETGRPGPEQALGFVRRRLRRDGGVGRLILSDENLAGVPALMVRQACLYPTLEERLAAVSGVLARTGARVEVYLALRPQDEFGRSVYLEALMNRQNRFRAPADFAEAWVAARPSFVPLIRAVADAFPDAALTLWEFADFRRDPQAVLRLLAGGDAPALDESRGSRRESPRRGEVLAQLARRESPAEDPGDPHGDADAPYVLWQPAQRDALRALWEADRAALGDLGPRVRWFRPG